jgi:hypothetical protein
MYLGSIITFQDRVLWTDFDPFVTQRTLDLFGRWDSTVFYNDQAINQALRYCVDDFAKSVFSNEIKCEYPSVDSISRDNLNRILKSRDQRREVRNGVLGTHGSCINLDTFMLYLQHHLMQQIPSFSDHSPVTDPQSRHVSFSSCKYTMWSVSNCLPL